MSTSIKTSVTAYLDNTAKSTGDGNYHATAHTVLNKFLTWCDTHEHQQLEALSPTDLRRYVQHLTTRMHDDEISASTVHTYFNIVRGYLSWCVTDSRIDTNPADSHPAIDALPDNTTDPSDSQQFWTPTEIKQLLTHVNTEAQNAINEPDTNSQTPVRDRALATTLTFSGARGAELFSSPNDSRTGRNGITWERVDLDNGTITVLGKNQNWEPAQLPDQATHALKQHYYVQSPATDDWPVFPSAHAPTLYNTAREKLAEHEHTENEINELITNADTAQTLLRTHDIAPPAITTEGARNVMKRLCRNANIDVNGEYLKPHGARRGLGNILYKEQAELAQAALRHESIETTHDAYNHVVTSDTSDAVSDVLETSLNSSSREQ